jgi:lipopolysaccharide transport system permease protein
MPIHKLSEIASRRELLVNLTLRELRGKYKRSFLGWGWSMLNPLMSLLIYSLVFRYFLRIPPEVGDPSGLDNFAMFLLTALLPFNFMANVFLGGMGSLIGNDSLVKRVYFPREILVAANTASWLVSFLIELGVLAVVLVFFGNIVVLWIPVVLMLVVIQLVFAFGIALMLSTAAVYFRDLQHLVGIFLQAWLYTAPIVYPISFVERQMGEDSWLFFLYNLNPATRFVEAYRDVLYDMRFPAWDHVAYLVLIAAASLVLGMIVFNRLEGRVADEL